MNFEVTRFEKGDWAKMSAEAHRVVFGGLRGSDIDTISFALVCGDGDSIYSFATIIEMDRDTAYMQHGGALPNVAGSIFVKRNYRAIINYLKDRYKRVSTRIHHKNVPMLKLALSEDLIVNGADVHSDGLYLNLIWGFE